VSLRTPRRHPRTCHPRTGPAAVTYRIKRNPGQGRSTSCAILCTVEIDKSRVNIENDEGKKTHRGPSTKEDAVYRLHLAALWALALLWPGTRADEPKDKKADDEVPVIRELSAKGVRFDRGGSVMKPAIIKSAKDLANVMPDEADRARVNKEVNWDKQYGLAFSWGGSGGDKLTSDVKKAKEGPEVVFGYTPGLTDDFRMHMRLYVLRKGVTWKFAK